MDIEIIETISGVRAAVAARRAEGGSVGLVPTMGALHAGHVSLIERSALAHAVTVVSIFVNPLQFGSGEDLEKYPRTLERDVSLCEKAGAAIVFMPRAAELYPADFSTFVDMTGPTEVLCGRARPHHFRGVLTVVAKLLNIIQPDAAYFGEKDAQQLAVVRKMTRELNMNVEIVGCPTVREPDGLAMSSRNTYLAPEERTAATCLSRALLGAENWVQERLRRGNSGDLLTAADEAALLAEARRIIAEEPRIALEYVELLDAETLAPVTKETRTALLAVAANSGDTRLIDNCTMRWTL